MYCIKNNQYGVPLLLEKDGKVIADFGIAGIFSTQKQANDFTRQNIENLEQIVRKLNGN